MVAKYLNFSKWEKGPIDKFMFEFIKSILGVHQKYSKQGLQGRDFYLYIQFHFNSVSNYINQTRASLNTNPFWVTISTNRMSHIGQLALKLKTKKKQKKNSFISKTRIKQIDSKINLKNE